jgi:D-sedoheptulose 7-phosphate isomerase
MEQYIRQFSDKACALLQNLPTVEIAKAMNILQAGFERDGRIYVIGNGGSLALATHWVADFNKTVFSHNLSQQQRRFQAIRLPTTEEELTAWANDVGYDMVFAGPLNNYIQASDILIAISSSGNSENIIRAVSLARSHRVPVIGISGFDGGRLNPLSDAKILVATAHGEYELVEGIHAVILHIFTKYFKDAFGYIQHARWDVNREYALPSYLQPTAAD